MNRRNFLKAAGAVTGAFMVPELIVPDKRFWALDRTMIKGDEWISTGWFDTSFPVLTKILVATCEMSPEMRRAFRNAYHQASMELERALLFGEYDTPMGEFVKRQHIKWK